jgi:Ca2+-transporting ATPase
LVYAIEEGRIIQENIKKFVLYLLSSNSAEILLVLVCTSMDAPTPFTTLQILWANLIGAYSLLFFGFFFSAALEDPLDEFDRCMFIFFQLSTLNLPPSLLSLLPSHLWTANIPALALGVDSPEEDVMLRPPRLPRSRLLSKGTTLILFGQTLSMTGLSLGGKFSGN